MYLYNSDYENLLKENLIKTLDWLVEEFNFLFKFKNQKYCQNDITLANQIVASFSKNHVFTNDEKMNEMFIKTLKTIENLYPMLLKSA